MVNNDSGFVPQLNPLSRSSSDRQHTGAFQPLLHILTNCHTVACCNLSELKIPSRDICDTEIDFSINQRWEQLDAKYPFWAQSLTGFQTGCSSEQCFPTIWSLPFSSSPSLGLRARLKNVALRKWLEPPPTPCCLMSFTAQSFLEDATITASTQSLAHQPQSFALEEVLPDYHLYFPWPQFRQKKTLTQYLILSCTTCFDRQALISCIIELGRIHTTRSESEFCPKTRHKQKVKVKVHTNYQSPSNCLKKKSVLVLNIASLVVVWLSSIWRWPPDWVLSDTLSCRSTLFKPLQQGHRHLIISQWS